MKVAVDLPLRELLRASLDYFATTPALELIALTYDSRDGKSHTKFLRDASGFQMGGVLDSWLTDDLTSKLEVNVTTNLIPATLPDNVVEVIAMNSFLYPSTIRDIILSDRELAHSGKDGRFGWRTQSFELRVNDEDGTSIFVFDDSRYTETLISPHNFRGQGIIAISHAIGKHVEYSYEPEPTIKDFLDSLQQAGRKLTCPTCGAPFAGKVPCMTEHCVAARNQAEKDYMRHSSEVQEWLVSETREGRINSVAELKACEKNLMTEFPDAKYLIAGAFGLAHKRIIEAYWEANADLKAIVEEEAGKYAREAVVYEQEIKRLTDELESLPGYKLFGNRKLKEQKAELAKKIEQATNEAKKLRSKRDNVLAQLKSLPRR